VSLRDNPLGERLRTLRMECPADTCPEQGEPVDVEHTWSTGEWWPPDPWPRCHHCGADLAYPKT
jgi:hypothetical protein